MTRIGDVTSKIAIMFKKKKKQHTVSGVRLFAILSYGTLRTVYYYFFFAKLRRLSWTAGADG